MDGAGTAVVVVATKKTVCCQLLRQNHYVLYHELFNSTTRVHILPHTSAISPYELELCSAKMSHRVSIPDLLPKNAEGDGRSMSSETCQLQYCQQRSAQAAGPS